jgi:hypothetical protein
MMAAGSVGKGLALMATTVSALLLTGLAGCGASLGTPDSSSSSSSSGSGGSSSSSGGSASSVTGIWSGDSTSTPTRRYTELALADGNFYLFYSGTESLTDVAGVVVGSGAVENSQFASTAAKEYNFEGNGAAAVSVQSTLSGSSTQTGSISNGGGRVLRFATTYQSDSAQSALISNVVGNYAGSVRSVAVTTPAGVTGFSINALGGFVGNINYGSGACALSGQLVVKEKINVFGVSGFTLAGASCVSPVSALSGVAYYSSDRKQLLVAIPNSSGSDLSAFYLAPN